MASRIIWSPRAQKDRKEILAYWIQRNGTPTYSLRLNAQIKNALQTIKQHPEAGKSTDVADVRFKWVRDYQMYYKLKGETVLILTLWDHRRDPSTFYL
jgi:plasmid stabilization system protein ParE